MPAKTPSKIQREALSVADVCEYLGLSQTASYDLFHAHGFPSFRIGKRLLVLRQDFDAWLTKQRIDDGLEYGKIRRVIG